MFEREDASTPTANQRVDPLPSEQQKHKTMRGDPIVSKRLQQTAEQLQAAIQRVRKRKEFVCNIDEESSEKSWQLSPTVLLSPEQDEVHSEVDKLKSNDTSVASDSVSHTPTTEAVDALDQAGILEIESHEALEKMQQDVKRQRHEIQVICELLVRAIHNITDVVVDVVNDEAANVLVCTAAAATGVSLETDNNEATLQLVPEKVEELIDLWDDGLVSWREKNLEEKHQLTMAFTEFEDECLARMKTNESLHKFAHERHVLESNQCQMYYEDYTSGITQKLESADNVNISLRNRVTDLSFLLTKSAAANARPVVSDAATETIDNSDILQNQMLNLAACAKSSDLHALRCEVELTEQVQRANELEARLFMLLEENEQRKCYQEFTNTSVNISHTVDMYQQKLNLLEGRVQDVQDQVACDHEQAEYEKAKWVLEKQHHREKYNEVLDTSVKVLKVLIIREKLLKKNERLQKRMNRKCQRKQTELMNQGEKLQGIATELMRRSAMMLLILQKLSVLKSDMNQLHDSWTMPAKPVLLMNTIKRLKKIKAELGQHDWTLNANSKGDSVAEML
ncbi:uncharacterized protein PHALS_08781 [Plasmopara halstedii]|uniref:Uncharacterized protein n=1 Tax=Plasmopara halstedii TaxID=4781 RepID=A0A0P1ADY8_PLAHL|nr:uncharacterized protein PHALS_08781 [Plasmopara halstedii]CEG38724.1 hypothetical protein PHALS_08781 [Plasmopara halstedii]|eukprot:XP_024575093.1 hypothetical protein PHALS_08781 [Plasmopara halstedii]